ncbi:MAG: glycoside hydrolase family 16 protein [Saprospiraceae bacterium]|nr:glycoside hydrolase family 16 protein [Saprospiraceae bacterium]
MQKTILIFVVWSFILRGSIGAQKTSKSYVLPDSLPTNPIDIKGWHLLCHDEFDTDSIDYHVWWPQSNETPNTLTIFTPRPDNVLKKQGFLHLINRKDTVKGYPFSGGMVFSAQKVEVNSRVEAKFKIPKGKSLWPCFWLLGGKDSIYQEVDIAEFGCSKPFQFNISNHFYNEKKKKVAQEFRTIYAKTGNKKRLDLSKDFHIYAIEWTTDQLRFFLDNILVYELNRNVPKYPMHLILSMGVGGLDGNPDTQTLFPAYFSFDYVRIYKKASNSK